jgi:hypothetical protein
MGQRTHTLGKKKKKTRQKKRIPTSAGGIDDLQSLYDAEINAQISWFWDGGFQWALGDQMNGLRSIGRADTISEAISNLLESAREEYPERAV